MSEQIIYSCEAFIYLCDKGNEKFSLITDQACVVQLISFDNQSRTKPGQLVAFPIGSRAPLLQINFDSIVSVKVSRNPVGHQITVATKNGWANLFFEIIGDGSQSPEFSHWLYQLTGENSGSMKDMGCSPWQHRYQSSPRMDPAPSLANWRLTSPHTQKECSVPTQSNNANSSVCNLADSFERAGREAGENINMSIQSLLESRPRNEINTMQTRVKGEWSEQSQKLRNLEDSQGNQALPENVSFSKKRSTSSTGTETLKKIANGKVENEKDDNGFQDLEFVNEAVKENQAQISENHAESALPEAPNECLCQMLEDAISSGNTSKASDMAVHLAKRKLLVTIKEILDEKDKKGSDTCINITVHIEDKQTNSPILIRLDVNPNITDVGALKAMVFGKYSIPMEVQRWVIGKRLPKDHETLINLEVKTSGTVVFLYLLAAKEVGIRKLHSEENRRIVTNKMPSLPPRDYKQDDREPLPPLNSRDHRFATAPAIQGQDVGDRNEAAMKFLNEFACGAPDESMSTGKKVFPSGPKEMARTPQNESMRTQGWKCPCCTFVNIPTRPGCEQCASSRPANYTMPANFAIDDIERLRLEQEAFQEQLTHNFEEQARKVELATAKENFHRTLQFAEAALLPNTEPFQCLVCLDDIKPNEGVKLRECLHDVCRGCLELHVKFAKNPEIHCPYTDGVIACEEVITTREIQAILPEEEFMKYLQLSVNAAESEAANSFHCRTTNCIGWCYYEDEVNWFRCIVCNKRNCLTCKAIHDNMTCKEYQDDLKRRSEDDEAAKMTQNMLEEMLRSGEAMKCPQCAVILQKKDGCDWMRCSMCKTEICWATKGRRWGPKGVGDTSGGCQCSPAKRCHQKCGNCH